MSNSSVLFICLIFHSEACTTAAAPASPCRPQTKRWAGRTRGQKASVAAASLLRKNSQRPRAASLRELPAASGHGSWNRWRRRILPVNKYSGFSRRRAWKSRTERVKKEVLVCKWNLRQAGVQRSCLQRLAVRSGQIPSMAIKALVCRVRKIASGTWGVVFTALALKIFFLVLRLNVVFVL